MTCRVRMAPCTPRKPLSINFAVSGYLNDKFQTRNDEEQSMTAIAPGSRVLIRDEEWLVRRVEPARIGSFCHNKDEFTDHLVSQI